MDHTDSAAVADRPGQPGAGPLAGRLPAGISPEDLPPALRATLEGVAAGRDALAILSPGSPRDAYVYLGAWLRGSSVLVISPESSHLADARGELVSWAESAADDAGQAAEAEGAAAVEVEAGAGAAEAEAAEGAEPQWEPEPESARHVKPLPEPEGEIIFATPEEIRDGDFREALTEMPIGLIVVDAAERVSPHSSEKLVAYGLIPQIVEKTGGPPLVALAFEASREVLDDVHTMLKLRDPVTTFADVLRPNIEYEVLRTVSMTEKRRTIERTLREVAGAGVVHSGTVSEAKSLAEHLSSLGFRAIMWHNKMKKAERDAIEADFRSGRARVAVAVTGSHMPTGRSDVRFVIHVSPPSSIETYVLEAGRVSRDGRRGLAVLLYDASDQKSQRLAAGSHFPQREEFERVYGALEELTQEEREIPVKDINALSGVSYARAKTIVSILKRAGYLRQAKSSKYVLLLPKKTHEQLAEDLMPYQGEEERLRDRRQAIIRYTRSTRCRAEYLAQHFGLSFGGPCGICDACRSLGLARAARAAAPSTATSRLMPEPETPVAEPPVVRPEPEVDLPHPPERIAMRFAVGDVVVHPLWGHGEVLESRDGKLTVDFPGTGEKKLYERHLSPGDASRLPKRPPRAQEKSARAPRGKAAAAKAAPAAPTAPTAAEAPASSVATEDEPAAETSDEAADSNGTPAD